MSNKEQNQPSQQHFLAVRCINNKGVKKDLKIDEIYQARQSKYFKDSYELNLDGSIITYKKERFRLHLYVRFCFSQNLCIGGVSSSTDLNHKCSIGELNLFLFFFVRWQKNNFEKLK